MPASSGSSAGVTLKVKLLRVLASVGVSPLPKASLQKLFRDGLHAPLRTGKGVLVVVTFQAEPKISGGSLGQAQ